MFVYQSVGSREYLWRYSSAAVLAACLTMRVDAHGDHDDIPDGEAMSVEPLDSTLWIHILLMILAFGLIFPAGMVLGIVRSRWHVPLQTMGAVIATVAYFLGHAHKGRQFAPNIHASFATSLVLMLILQVVFGVYLKLHLEKGIHGRVRKAILGAHGALGKAMPVVSWVQMLFGGITAQGFCRGDHLGQCLAHFIMGSAFIGYGIVMTILLLVGQFWLRRTGRSQEFFDSLLIAAWGCVNTFTEHRWGQPWVKNDIQHTSMGVVWWCAGLLGVWLSRSRSGRPRRNLIPGIVIFMTGWAMSAHPQNLELSTMVHAVFGYTLMAAGGTRIIEIAFVLHDARGFREPNSFQYLPPFLLYASGFLFMGATEEQMQLLSDANVTHVSYILILYSIAFLLFLFVNILLHIYAQYVWPIDPSKPSHPKKTHRGVKPTRVVVARRPGILKRQSSNGATPSGSNSGGSGDSKMNGGVGAAAGAGSTQINGKVRMPPPPPKHKVTDSQQVRDAEEFELHQLLSEDDEDEETRLVSPEEEDVELGTKGSGKVRL